MSVNENASVRVVRSVSPSTTALSILVALLADARCACGRSAERLTIETLPHAQDDWKTGRKRKTTGADRPHTLVATWCGSVETHMEDMEDTLAMTEDDC